MRTFVVLCLVALAAAQYDYTPQSNDYSGAASQDDFSSSSGSNEFNKEFFTFSAPENDFYDGEATEKIANALKKTLRVVFIKGPENSALENAALQLAKSAAEERTAIYVLNKQADINELANKLNSLNNNNNKPEVHFVKYRTQADAENAQRTIQSQYDSLPGSSSSSNGGSASVLDFASKSSAVLAGQSSSSSNVAAPSNSYIPPQSTYLPPGRRF